MNIQAAASTVLHASKKRLFGRKPIYECYAKTTNVELCAVEARVGAAIPADLRDWLLLVGYGDINEALSFREEWFKRLDRGPLVNTVVFAQDILGNHYVFSVSGEISYLCRTAPEYALVAQNFLTFITNFIEAGYSEERMIETFRTQRYELQSD